MRSHYAGIELEVNQRFATGDTPRFLALRKALVDALHVVDDALPEGPVDGMTKRPGEGVERRS